VFLTTSGETEHVRSRSLEFSVKTLFLNSLRHEAEVLHANQNSYYESVPSHNS